MSLTESDLLAIQNIVSDSNQSLKQELIKRIDSLDDTLSQQMEHGLQEVRDSLQRVEDKIDDVARVQQAEVKRVDSHSKSLSKLRRALHAA